MRQNIKLNWLESCIYHFLLVGICLACLAVLLLGCYMLHSINTTDYYSIIRGTYP